MAVRYILLILIIGQLATACKKPATNGLMQDHTQNVAGTWNFKKYDYVNGSKQYVKDTAFTIEVINDTLLRVASVLLPYERESLVTTYQHVGSVIHANTDEYLLFGTDGSSIVAVEYYYMQHTVTVENIPGGEMRTVYESAGKL